MLNYIHPVIASFKEARQKKGLSQSELAKKVGLPQSHISKIEAGQVDIQLTSFAEIAHALDLEIVLVPREQATIIKNLLVTKSNIHSEESMSPMYTLDEGESDENI